MSGSLRGNRILSSDADASVRVKQNSNTNITLKLENSPSQANLKEPADSPMVPQQNTPQPQNTPTYPPPIYPPGQEHIIYQDGQLPSGQVMYPRYQQDVATREIDLTANLEDKDHQIEVLESMLECYENNPLKLNNYVICKSSKLMNMIKILTGAEKVEFALDEDKSCKCCGNKYIHISNIFITKDGKTVDFKYGYNEMYSLLQKHAISLKICI